ncbi:MAG: nucleotidyltransferase family protein [Silicimonas sp.]|nr:nucleotidyltransferase family protein [Silicimonas sp.]
MKTKALLLAGGLGTRLRPITETVPKCLVLVAGRPMLDYWYDALEKAGIADVLLNTHHHAEQVRAHIAETNATRALTVTEAYEPELLGSAGTVHANPDWADDADAVLIIYADNLSDVDLAALLSFHASHDDPMTMMLFHTAYPKQCGIATLEGTRIVDFVEKPEHPASDLANAGLYVVDADCWREIADRDVFDFGFDVLSHYIGKMQGFTHEGYHRDIGNHEALAHANIDAPRLFS